MFILVATGDLCDCQSFYMVGISNIAYRSLRDIGTSPAWAFPAILGRRVLKGRTSRVRRNLSQGPSCLGFRGEAIAGPGSIGRSVCCDRFGLTGALHV